MDKGRFIYTLGVHEGPIDLSSVFLGRWKSTPQTWMSLPFFVVAPVLLGRIGDFIYDCR